MGWLCYDATHYKNGKVDRKAEMDSIFNWHDDVRTVSVLKSAMVGSTYYAAVRCVNTHTGIDNVSAAVCLTCGSKDNGGFNFGYKDMDETMGPYQYDCPKSILDLLSPTDNKTALEWRRLCRENLKRKSELAKARYVKFKFPFDITWSDGYMIKAWEPVILEHSKMWERDRQRRWFIPNTFKVVRNSTIKRGTVVNIIPKR